MSLFEKAKKSPLLTCPIEIVECILCKLPVKSLLRFRCVGKSWNSLISDPIFARMHLRENNHHHLLLKFNHTPHVRPLLKSYPLSSTCRAAVTLPLDRINCYDSVVGSCDGIICFSITDSSTFLLWNPSIRTLMELPPLKEMDMEGTQSITHSCGFGYDHLTQTYKVVAVSLDINKAPSEIMVHTVGTDCWRRIEEEEKKFPSSFHNDKSGKFVNGTLNWLTFESRVTFESRDDADIFSFNLGNESCQLLCAPDLPEDGLILGVLRDWLCVFSLDDMFCDVWAMKEHLNDKSWTKWFSIPQSEGDLDLYPYNEGIYICDDDDQVPLPSFSNLVVCNYETYYEKLFKIIDIRNGQAFWFQEPHKKVFPCSCDEPKVYVESLISPYPLNNRM